jgi:hypothetical protein
MELSIVKVLAIDGDVAISPQDLNPSSRIGAGT